MKIRKLVIKNFRGIQELNWDLPDKNVFCLIGKGDSSKSTILEAIRYVFYPQWNLTFSDSDFFECNNDNLIQIEATIGNILEEFYSIEKYGNYLRGWNINDLKLVDEPDDDHPENVLTIRLSVSKDLEPFWEVICDRADGKAFKYNDRDKVAVSLIGTYSDKQLTWASGTPLSKLTESKKLDESLLEATRAAKSSLDLKRDTTLKSFDEAATKSEKVAKLLGVPIKTSYKAHLDITNTNIKIGGLTLHDGDMPLRLLGLGSRRMLLCGIQKLGLNEKHITLFDEVEFGLEPHRIARLLKHIKEDLTGQYFLTTHSPMVLKELTIDDLYIIHNKAGIVEITTCSKSEFIDFNIQGKLRSCAEAFLSEKVVICEGATEVGFLRGLDDFWINSGEDSFSYLGVALLDANGGSKIKSLATGFKALSYPAFVLADGDVPKDFSITDASKLESIGVKVLIWSDDLALEQRAMFDLPWEYVLKSVNLAENIFGCPVYENVHSKYLALIDKDSKKWLDTIELRKAIGDAAKASSWFKNISKSEQWANEVSPAFLDLEFLKTDFAVKLNLLSKSLRA